MRFYLVSLLIFLAAGCSVQIAGISDEFKGYNQQDHNVIESHGQIDNPQYLDEFIRSVDKGEDAEVRIVSYTSEGDPVFKDLNFNGEEIEYKLDTTQDQFGADKVSKKKCKEINRIDRTKETVYEVSCGKNTSPIDLLTIDYDANRQDSFEIDFSYDNGNRVNISTQKQSLTVQSDENIITQNGFQFTEAQLNQIYKLLVLENYMEEKDLSARCSQSPDYSMTVTINGGQRVFEWSDCDEGADVADMTQMAERVIDIIEKTQSYRNVFE